MKEIYISDDNKFRKIDAPEPGCWINLMDPAAEDCEEIAANYGIDIMDLTAPLDEEESSRVNVEEGYTEILVDIPVDDEENTFHYYTIPLGIIITKDMIITVCSQKTPILTYFSDTSRKGVNTRKRLRFTYQILYQAAMLYQSDLRNIDRTRTYIEDKADDRIETTELIALHQLESSLVYFATSLRANEGVLDRLQRYVRIKKYPDDQDLLEDTIIENKQAIEMTNIYRDIISGTQDLMASISDKHLNNVMKYLTSITLVMAVPTIISGFYGMNVDARWMPLAEARYGFYWICLITILICIIIIYMLKKRRML